MKNPSLHYYKQGLFCFFSLVVFSSNLFADHGYPPPAPNGVLECVWSEPGYQPYNNRTQTLVGKPKHGFLYIDACRSAINASNEGLVCNWNGANHQPYDYWSNIAFGKVDYGFLNLEGCNETVRTAKNGLACAWTGKNYQPYRVSGNLAIGNFDYGFVNLSACTEAVQGSSQRLVCNWYGTGFMAYEIQTNQPTEHGIRRFPTLQDCNQYISYSSGNPWPPVPPPNPIEKEITVHCKSTEFAHNNCDASGIRITQAWVIFKQSNAECREGYSWGVTSDHTAIWVDHGCEALFGAKGFPKQNLSPILTLPKS